MKREVKVGEKTGTQEAFQNFELFPGVRIFLFISFIEQNSWGDTLIMLI
jgi:hypothetical protein